MSILEVGRKACPKHYFWFQKVAGNCTPITDEPLRNPEESSSSGIPTSQSINVPDTASTSVAGDLDPIQDPLFDITDDLQRRADEDALDDSELAWDLDDDQVEMDTDIDSELLDPIPLASLFNFDSREWIAVHERSATKSLEEELELYELADLDAEGDPDEFSIDIDSTLQSIM